MRGRMKYDIKVEGTLDQSWSDWLEAMTVGIETRPGRLPLTTLSGSVADQSALRGILNRLWDLNLTLVSVNRRDKE